MSPPIQPDGGLLARGWGENCPDFWGVNRACLLPGNRIRLLRLVKEVDR